MGPRWVWSGQADRFCFAHWGDEVVVYDARQGVTHLLSGTVAAMARQHLDNDGQVADMAAVDADAAQALARIGLLRAVAQ